MMVDERLFMRCLALVGNQPFFESTVRLNFRILLVTQALNDVSHWFFVMFQCYRKPKPWLFRIQCVT